MSGTVAVIGGGIQGTLCALACSAAGWRVTLFERKPKLWQGASANNEGKIHLGFTYGLDKSGATQSRLAELGGGSKMRWRRSSGPCPQRSSSRGGSSMRATPRPRSRRRRPKHISTLRLGSLAWRTRSGASRGRTPTLWRRGCGRGSGCGATPVAPFRGPPAVAMPRRPVTWRVAMRRALRTGVPREHSPGRGSSRQLPA